MEFRGKVALVTGASRGIGSECAIRLAKEGANVIINYLDNKEKALEVKDKIADQGVKVEVIKADVSNREEVFKMAEIVKQNFGTLDILVNNATASILLKDFLSTKWEDFQRDLDILVKGAANCLWAFLPFMTEKKSGCVINIITYGTMGVPPSKLSCYVTAKNALLGLSKALAVEYGPLGIRINMVSPGLTQTDLINYLPERAKEIIAQNTPLKRIAQPSDIASAVIFLASSEASFITGCNIPVCGGIAMY